MSNSLYIPVIGLEIHAELHTKSKMFCSCKNDPLERSPNVHICPICMAHPGTLPTLNKTAIEHVLKVGTALGSDIADFTEWDRKNYFYPDIPKGYQISQYAFPLVQNGSLTVKNEAGVDVKVGITRIHLEEDTARSNHDKGDFSAVDYNRAGVPLMELVTNALDFSIKDAKTAGNFGKELQLLLQTLGVSEANMELGQMRVEVNISIYKEGQPLGTKVEIKNLNSFRAAERSIAYEIERQAAVLDAGEKVVQETRGFDETTGKTFSQRVKENANDYRYFPDPDLPKLYISSVPEWSHEALLASLPKLPWVRRAEYLADGLKAEDAEMFISDKFYGDYFETVLTDITKPELKKLAVNYIATDMAGLVKKESERGQTLDMYLDIKQFIDILHMIENGELSSRGAKDMIAHLWKADAELRNTDAKSIAEEKGFIIKNDPEALKKMIQGVIDANPTQVEGFKAGKEPLLMYLVGQVMKEAKGAVNPGTAQEMLREMLR
ncbi:MAG: Asp-tRNA(Asn)/Glu-tRNA(Gln) amidotransferase subunit GatB [Patescibacteria group bacterium]